jgi:hypothetical protein
MAIQNIDLTTLRTVTIDGSDISKLILDSKNLWERKLETEEYTEYISSGYSATRTVNVHSGYYTTKYRTTAYNCSYSKTVYDYCWFAGGYVAGYTAADGRYYPPKTYAPQRYACGSHRTTVAKTCYKSTPYQEWVDTSITKQESYWVDTSANVTKTRQVYNYYTS